MHPFAPAEQAAGYRELIGDLEALAGRGHRLRRGVACSPTPARRASSPACWPSAPTTAPAATTHRDVCLIPSSAHGTNAASAVMAGMRVVVVACDDDGNVDLDDLRRQDRRSTRDRLAALMVTYPSTHGVYEERHRRAVRRWCTTPAARSTSTAPTSTRWSGCAKPGRFGADVSPPEPAQDVLHPARRRRPGRRPGRRCARTWRRTCPNHPLQPTAGPATGSARSSAAPWGSAGILPISWAYIRLMGADGLRAATQVGDPRRQLRRRAGCATHYPVLYTGRERPGRARVHPRPAADHQGDRRHRRRRGQAADRLRLPRADDVVPGGRHADGRADRVARTWPSSTGSATR